MSIFQIRTLKLKRLYKLSKLTQLRKGPAGIPPRWTAFKTHLLPSSIVATKTRQLAIYTQNKEISRALALSLPPLVVVSKSSDSF